MSWIQTTAVLLTWNESNRYTWCMLLRTGKKKNFFMIKSNHLHRRCSTAGFISLICPFFYVTACSNTTADRQLLPVVEPSISDRRTLNNLPTGHQSTTKGLAWCSGNSTSFFGIIHCGKSVFLPWSSCQQWIQGHLRPARHLGNEKWHFISSESNFISDDNIHSLHLSYWYILKSLGMLSVHFWKSEFE